MKVLIIIPTYNERDNIQRLIPLLLALNDGANVAEKTVSRTLPFPLPGLAQQAIQHPASSASQDLVLEILVVDDNSPDGTGRIVEEMGALDPRIQLLHRPAKMGLGSAYIAGFKEAIQHPVDCIFEMDADFSHDPRYIPQFLEKIQAGYDVVIGSRYIRGVNVVNWPMSRLLLSYFANRYTHWVTGLPVKDATSGFKCFRREVLAALDLDAVQSDGYAFQIEMNVRCWANRFKLYELPIVFVDRHSGSSKMSRRIVYEAAWMVWWLRLQKLLGRL